MPPALHRLGAAVLVLAGSAVATFAQAEQTIPFRFEDLRLYVPTTVGGRSGEVVLDTGASDVLIDSATAAALGLKSASERSEHGAGAGSFQMGDGGAVSLSVGGVPLKVSAADIGAINKVLAPFNGMDIVGVVGAPFFHEHVVEIDFAARRLTLHDPASFAYQGPGLRLPIKLEDDSPVVSGELVLGDGTKLPLRLLIDLGAKADLLVAEPFVEANGLKARMAPTVIAPLGAGVGGPTRYAFARLARIKVGGVVAASDLIAGLSENGSLRGGDGYDALLGAGFLQRFKVIIDYSRQEMIFEPRSPAPAERFDRSGLFVTAAGQGLSRLVVHEVIEGSAAAQAGVCAGDVITRVDGKPASALRLWDVRRALSEPGDRVVKLSLRRRGRPVAAAIRLRDLI